MPYGGGQSGMGGSSGMVMSLPDHNEELVTTVREKKARNRDINIVSPFAGKTFCFGEWKKTLAKMPVDDAHVIVYDNSNDVGFGRRLEEFCKKELASYKLCRDTNAHLTMELSNDWNAIGKRCRAVYGIIYNELIDKSKTWCLNIEDDIGAPVDAWERLYFHAQDESVATVVGKCYDRRALKDRGLLTAIAMNFEERRIVGPDENTRQIELVHLPDRSYGVEPIGAGHMGLWLTKTQVINELGMGHQFENLCGNDVNWGYAVNEAGYRFAHDWGIKLKHFYKDHSGKKMSC